MATEPAPAKINLTLHVTGQRADGYHLLDSLAVFTELGDTISMTPARGLTLTLTVTGPLAAGVPTDASNLVLRAARLMGVDAAAITLDKHLPAASGIGGGSSDAAAALRLFARQTGRPLPGLAEVLRLGADLPVCIDARPCRMSGLGEVLTPAPPMPPVWLVLANPGVPMPTPAVFAALRDKAAAPMPAALPRCTTATELAAFLRMQRNDLQAAAHSLAPVIGTVVTALGAQPGCLIARMSGSGATCYGLFADPSQAAAAARSIGVAEPSWWVKATGLRG